MSDYAKCVRNGVVSDNSATKTALVGRSEEQQRNYYAGFEKLAKMIFSIAEIKVSNG